MNIPNVVLHPTRARSAVLREKIRAENGIAHVVEVFEVIQR
jgi:hypothetical protein